MAFASVKIDGIKFGAMIYAKDFSVAGLAREIGASRETIARWVNKPKVGINPGLWRAVVAALKLTDAEVAAVKLADARPRRASPPEDRAMGTLDRLGESGAAGGGQDSSLQPKRRQSREAKSK